MSTTTPNLNLTKPDGTPAGDYVDVAVLDTNFDLIDTAIGNDRTRLTSLENTVTNNPAAIANPIRVRKLADEPVTNSTAVQNDDELLFAMVANIEYEVDIMLKVKNLGGAFGGFQCTFTFPAVTYCELHATSGGSQLQQPTALSISSGSAGFIVLPAQMTANYFSIKIKAFIKPTANGNFQLQWAQNVAAGGGNGTVVGAGSFLVARRVA